MTCWSRYTAGHPVEYVEVGLFFVGLMAILRRGRQAVGQLFSAQAVQLAARGTGAFTAQISSLLEQIAALCRRRLRQTLYAQRIVGRTAASETTRFA